MKQILCTKEQIAIETSCSDNETVIPYFSRLFRYLAYMRKWSRPPEELVSASNKLWTVIGSATEGHAGAIFANAAAPTVLFPST